MLTIRPKTAAYALFSVVLLVPHATLRAEPEPGPPVPTRSPAVEITASDAISTTGFYGVSWAVRDDAPLPAEHALVRFEVQEAALPPDTDAVDSLLAGGDLRYETLYTGADRATTRTGIPNGRYAYRARAFMAVRTVQDADSAAPDTAATAWSPPVVVEVRHHALGKALGFLALGAVIFLATLALILAGSRRAGRAP